ncbi:MAG: agmatine deiminase family protein [Dehalococcoidia bacterium]|nr:agmatine deiminase family protein [Dehalococcoidia bacterium]
MKKGKLSPEDFRMPAEWEEHEGTWLQWPHDDQWPGQQLRLEKTWLEMVNALYEHENVHIIVQDERRREHVEQQLKFFDIGLKNVGFHIIPTNDVWARDNGPIFVVNKERKLAITDWKFNGWGNRYEHEIDNHVPSRVGKELSIPIFSPSMVMEGGAVEVNGKSTFMATRSSIINPNRNPGKTQKDVEEIIARHFGIKHFIWLTGAPDAEKWGDDTDWHVDIAARFVNESTVIYNWAEEDTEPRYSALKVHREELQRATTETGKRLTLVPLPLPKCGVYPISETGAGEGMASGYTDAAYSNFLIANGVVLVPVFGNVNDDRAKRIIGEQFPGRDIIGINCVALNEGGGAIHCVTQQQPVSKTEE